MLAAYACGLMAKPMVVTLPVVLLLLDIWPLARVRSPAEPARAAGDEARAIDGRDADRGRRWTIASWLPLLREKVPLLAMSVAVAIVTVIVQGRVGAVVSRHFASPSMRLFNALVSCASYLADMLWPSGLAAIYPYPPALPVWQAAAASLLLAALIVCVVRVRRRAPYLFVGWLWYLVTLLPVLGFIQAGPQARADRYTYIAMVGIAVMVVWALEHVSRPMRYQRSLLACGSCLVLAAWAVVSSHQVEYWRNTEAVFRRALDVTTGNYVAHHGLGTALLHAGRTDEAVTHLREAVSIAPTFAEGQSDLGAALLAANEPEEALVHLTRAVQLRPADPEFRLNCASALSAVNRTADAEVQYREALRIARESYKAHLGLGVARAQQGDLDGAREEMLTAIHLNPGYADAYLNLGTLLARMGRNDEAAQAFSELARLTPDAPDAHIRLGGLFASEGRMDAALAELSIAVRMKPDDAELQSNLGSVMAAVGRLDEAVAHLSEAVRLRPDRPELRKNLEIVQAMRAGAASRNE